MSMLGAKSVMLWSGGRTKDGRPAGEPFDAAVIQAHDIDGDHYHDSDDYEIDNLDDDGLWRADNVELVSVGIDIGSSGTQVVFSRIALQRLRDRLTSRYYVISREQLYQSPITLTPYAAGNRIDQAVLGSVIDDAYQAAGLTHDSVDTGAVILTGEALRRENAEGIADLLAARGGQFVCTMAGHHIEAMLAAYGSGAAWMSNERAMRILNIDIGGGTTKFALIEQGRVLATAAIHVGGRLHVFDEAGALVRLEPAGQALAAKAGMDWQLGQGISDDEADRLADWMARAIVAALGDGTLPDAIGDLFLTERLPSIDEVGGIIFSGGVSEYVYDRESASFNDMGQRLGRKLRDLIAEGRLPKPVLTGGTGIRATALGVSEYSVQLSGNTIYVSNPLEVLPRRNLRVVRPDYDFPDVVEPAAVAASIERHLAKHDLVGRDDEIALAFHWHGLPSYARIAGFADGLILGLRAQIDRGDTICVVLDGDIARTLGKILHEERALDSGILVVDGISLSDLDYIDIGNIRSLSRTVPITVKSLLFGQDPRGAENLRKEVN
jgi:ethanolamine utilization protein EutA